MSSIYTVSSSDKKNKAGRAYAGKTQDQRMKERREQLINAGLEIFGTEGYKSATVKQICRQAGLTDRYFYQAFGSSENLLIAVYERELQRIKQAVQAAIEPRLHDDPVEIVRAGLQTFFEHAMDPRVARVCWIEVLGVSRRVDQTYTRTIEEFIELVLTYARQQMPELSLSSDEERILGTAAVGAASQTVMHWSLGGYKENIDTVVSMNLKVFRGLMLGLS